MHNIKEIIIVECKEFADNVTLISKNKSIHVQLAIADYSIAGVMQ